MFDHLPLYLFCLWIFLCRGLKKFLLLLLCLVFFFKRFLVFFYCLGFVCVFICISYSIATCTPLWCIFYSNEGLRDIFPIWLYYLLDQAVINLIDWTFAIVSFSFFSQFGIAHNLFLKYTFIIVKETLCLRFQTYRKW